MSRPAIGRAAWVVALLVSASQGFAQPASRASAPVVRAFVDRTAIWVGDRVTYTVEIVCPRGIDVLEDDLAKDRLTLEGLEVVTMETSRTEGPDQVATRRFRYVLTSYRVNIPALRVAPFSIRYYATRPGQRLQEAAPAGEVRVPGAVVALRSMLPEAQETFALRDERSTQPRGTIAALAQPIGIALVVVSIVPAAVWALAVAARRRQRRPTRSGRQVRRTARALLEEARSIDLGAPEGRREAYTRIEAIVRDHLAHAAGIAGHSLTPEEIEPALAGQTRLPAGEVSALLAECERARYGPLDAAPSADACRDALARADELVAGR